jgi:hypothetical protein
MSVSFLKPFLFLYFSVKKNSTGSEYQTLVVRASLQSLIIFSTSSLSKIGSSFSSKIIGIGTPQYLCREIHHSALFLIMSIS